MQTSVYEASDTHDAILHGLNLRSGRPSKSIGAIKPKVPNTPPEKNATVAGAAIPSEPMPSAEELAIGKLATEIRTNFIIPSFSATSFSEYWQTAIESCHSKLNELFGAIRAVNDVPVEVIYHYALSMIDSIRWIEWLSFSGAAREIDYSAEVFRVAVCLDRTNRQFPPVNNEDVKTERRTYSVGMCKTFIALLAIDTPEFFDSPSPSLAWHVFQLLRDGAWGMYHYSVQSLSARMPSDVRLFVKEHGLMSDIENALIYPREELRKIRFLGIGLETDGENRFVEIKTHIPLPQEEIRRLEPHWFFGPSRPHGVPIIRVTFSKEIAPMRHHGVVSKFEEGVGRAPVIQFEDGHTYYPDHKDKRYEVWRRMLTERITEKLPMYLESDEDNTVRYLFFSSARLVELIQDQESGAIVMFQKIPSISYLNSTHPEYAAMRDRLESAAANRNEAQVAINPVTREIVYVG